MLPDINNSMHKKQQTVKANHDKHSRHRTFKVSDGIQILDFNTGNGWISGTIAKTNGPFLFNVRLQDGQIVH